MPNYRSHILFPEIGLTGGFDSKTYFFILIPTHVATIFPYLSQLDQNFLTPCRFENDPCRFENNSCRFENHHCEFESIFQFLVRGIEIQTCGFEIYICRVENMACCLELILVRLLFLNYICGIETLHVVSKRLVKFLKSHTVMLEKPGIFVYFLFHSLACYFENRLCRSDFASCCFEATLCGFENISNYFDSMTCEVETVTCGFDIVSCCLETTPCCFDISLCHFENDV